MACNQLACVAGLTAMKPKGQKRERKGGSVRVGGKTPHMPQWERTSRMAGAPPPKNRARR